MMLTLETIFLTSAVDGNDDLSFKKYSEIVFQNCLQLYCSSNELSRSLASINKGDMNFQIIHQYLLSVIPGRKFSLDMMFQKSKMQHFNCFKDVSYPFWCFVVVSMTMGKSQRHQIWQSRLLLGFTMLWTIVFLFKMLFFTVIFIHQIRKTMAIFLLFLWWLETSFKERFGLIFYWKFFPMLLG